VAGHVVIAARQDRAFGRKLVDRAGEALVGIKALNGLPYGPALGNGHGIAERITLRQFLEDFRHAGAGRYVEIARLDHRAFFHAAAELAENEGVGDEALLFQAPRSGRKRIARLDTENPVLARGAIAIILRGHVEDATTNDHEVDDKKRQEAVEDV